MRLVHSISMTLFVSMAAAVSACGSEEPAGGGGGGSGGTATGGTAGAVTGGTAGAAGSGTSGAAGSGTSGTGGGANDHPTDSSQAGLEAFLAMNTYLTAGAGFRPETMASEGMMMPHMAVKRYFNETLIASKAAGNTGNSHTVGSMAIKDILNGTTVVGKAAMLRSATSWIYYCVSSEAGRCSTGSVANTPTYATTGGTACACHSAGTIISSAVIPAP